MALSLLDAFESVPDPQGIPSHDTFLAVFGKLDPAKFSQAFNRRMAAVEQVFADGIAAVCATSKVDRHHTVDAGHGRHEDRSITELADPPGLPPEWPDVACIVPVYRGRERNGVNSTSTQSDSSSHAGTAKEFAGLIRGHWGIEYVLHRVLDVVFREDDSRTRSGHAAANLAMVRKVCVAWLKKSPGPGSLKSKRRKAGWDDGFLLQAIQ